MKKGVGGGGPASVNIPMGEKISARPHPKIGLKFSRVSKAGIASATPVSTYPPHPKGKFLGEVFDIKTTAVFSGVATVALSFDGKGMTEEQKNKLKVYRHDLKKDSVWEELKSTIDTKNDVAYGETDHFSIFGVR
jgi:hypothetical protein